MYNLSKMYEGQKKHEQNMIFCIIQIVIYYTI